MKTLPAKSAHEASSDYEDLSDLTLDCHQLDELVGGGGECVFNWSTRDGYPMGVVVRYLYRDGTFWTTSVDSRTRLRALATRPQSAVVVNKDGKSATFKGNSVIHRSSDADWDAIKSWFFAAFSGIDKDPQNVGARTLERSLDTPRQVIVETAARLVVSFDFTKLMAVSTGPQSANGNRR